MKTMYFTLVILSVLFVNSIVSYGQTEPKVGDQRNRKSLTWLDLHTRLVVASPNQTFQQLDTVNYGFQDLKTLNLGGSMKVQFFNALYGEYALLYSLYRQTTSQVMAGIETPTQGLRLGIRYLFSNNQLKPAFEEENQDMQMYINFGGARGGLEIAIGNLNEIIGNQNQDLLNEIKLSDIRIKLNMALWTSSKP